MDPLRISISLRGPMVEPLQAFHLDALLGSLRVQMEEDARGAIDPKTVHHDIPVDRYTSPSGAWVFKASAFKLTKLSPTFLWMQTGRANLIQAAEDRASGLLSLRSAKPVTAGGPFKSSVSQVDMVWAELTAYAIGNQLEIEKLLAQCAQVGARRSTGFGNVSSIEVEVVDQSLCHWDWRALPEDYNEHLTHSDSLVLAQGNLRAPYWDKRSYERVFVPSSL